VDLTIIPEKTPILRVFQSNFFTNLFINTNQYIYNSRMSAMRQFTGSKNIVFATVLMSVFFLFSAYPVIAQETTVTIDIDQIEQKADFTLGSQAIITITGNFTIDSESAIPVTVYFGIHAPDGWETEITPSQTTVTFSTEPAVVSFQGEVKPEASSEQQDYEIFVWASVENDKPSPEVIINGDPSDEPSVFSAISLIEVIKNRVNVIWNIDERSVLPDSVRTHTFSVTNLGTVSDIFSIDLIGDESLESEEWQISQDKDELSLDPGEVGEFTIEEIIPPDAPVGDYELEVVVSSSGHAASKSSQTLTTKVRVPKIQEPLNLMPFLIIGFIGVGIGLSAFFAATEIGYLALLSLFLPLYVRLKKKDVLSHFTRGQIFGYIQANPGAHYNAIIQYIGLQNGVGAYHLKVLEREGYIKSVRDGIYKRFYPQNMRIPEKRLHLSRIQVDILHEIQRHPGVSQKQISRLLDESKQVVNYNVKILESAGLIRLERAGRETACFAGNVKYIPEEDVYEVKEDTSPAQVVNI
jgi:DNA-binding MarR family transcriptional regulator